MRTVGRYVGVAAMVGLATLTGAAEASLDRVTLEFRSSAGVEDPASISFLGKAHADGVRVALPSSKGADVLGPAGRRVLDYVMTLGSGSSEAVAAFWLPEEQESVRKRFNAERLEKVRKIYGAANELRFLAEIAYGNYHLVLVELTVGDKSLPSVYPLKKTGGGTLHMTNELSSDQFLKLARPLAKRLAEGTAVLAGEARVVQGAPEDGREVTFLTDGGKGLRVLLQPRGTNVNGVEVAFRGKTYREGMVLFGAGESESVPEQAVKARYVADFIQAFREGTHEEVTEFWAPDQRERFQEFFPLKSFEAQGGFFRKAKTARLLAELRYGGCDLFVVGFGDPASGRTQVLAIRNGSSPLLTYELLSDPIFTLWRGEWAKQFAFDLAQERDRP